MSGGSGAPATGESCRAVGMNARIRAPKYVGHACPDAGPPGTADLTGFSAPQPAFEIPGVICDSTRMTDAPANPSPLQGIRVLVLDDEEQVRTLLRRDLTYAGCQVDTAADGRLGLAILMREDFDVIIVDIKMPNMGGGEFIREVRHIWPWLGIVIITGFTGAREVEEARAVGVERVVAKPFQLAELRQQVLAEAQEKRRRVLSSDSAFDRIQHELGLLRHFSETAVAAESLTEALRALSYGLAQLLPCAAVGVLNLQPAGKTLILTVTQPVSLAFVECVQDLILQRMTALTGTVITRDAVQLLYEGAACQEDAPAAVGSTLSVPIISGQQVRGLLTLAAAAEEAFSHRDISFLYHAANQLSTVILALNRMRQFAVRDGLTELFNRKGIEEELERVWLLAQRYHHPVGFVIFDIDHFKTLNDTYGHPVGDQLLREFAQLVRATARVSDIAGRYGGDEFVVILAEADTAATRAFCERLLDAIHRHVFCESTHALKLTASIGFAVSPAEETPLSASEVLSQADHALYNAKRSGRNRICGWEDLVPRPPPEPRGAAQPGAAPAEEPSRARVLLVDDDPNVILALQSILESEGYQIAAADTAATALKALREQPHFDIVMTDLNLPDGAGLDLLDKIHAQDDTIVRIVITGQATVDNAIACLRRGAFDFIEKPIHAGQLLAVLEKALEHRRLLVENRRYQHHIEDMVRRKSAELSDALLRKRAAAESTLEALAALIDAREHSTGQHSLRVGRLARLLARRLGLSEKEAEEIGHGALLHDIGKIAIPDSILLKPGPLAPEEWQVMKMHPEIGYNILRSHPDIISVAEIIHQHQERYDGSGYPRGLRGEQICLGARIFAVIDAYDAIRSTRAYSKSRSRTEAVGEITRESGRQFDPQVVTVFVEHIEEIEAVGAWPAE